MSNDRGVELADRERDGTAAFSIGALTALIVGAAALIVGIIPWHRLGIALLTMSAVLGLGFVYSRSLASTAAGARSTLVGALAMLGFVPVIAQAAYRTLCAPLGATLEQGPAQAASIVFAALCSFAVASVVAWWWGTRTARSGARILRVAALSSVLVCCLLAVVTLARSAPPADTYPEALPLAAELPPEQTTTGAFAERRPGARDVGPSGFALGRTCLADGCFVHVRNHTDVRTIGPMVAREAALGLRHDAEARTVFLTADSQVVAAMDASLSAWDWVLPSAVSVAQRVSAPRSFLGLALLALCGAAVALGWQRRLSAHHAAVSGATAGFAQPNGWARLDDGSARRLAAAIPAGPIVITERSRVVSMAYRGSARDPQLEVRRGARAALLEMLELRIVTTDAVTLAWVLALAAPLLAAAALGFLF